VKNLPVYLRLSGEIFFTAGVTEGTMVLLVVEEIEGLPPSGAETDGFGRLNILTVSWILTVS
jgi:hypothetical protein